MKEIQINLKMKALKLFLVGHTYDEIAEKAGIVKDSVVNIINEFREGLISFHLSPRNMPTYQNPRKGL